MGTNYYLQIFTEEDIQEIIQLVRDRSFYEAIEKLQILSSKEKTIHIGKSCYNWKFSFNHHDWRYFETRKELEEWLKSGVIVTECNERVSTDDFWRMVKNKENGRGMVNPDFDLEFSEHIDFS